MTITIADRRGPLWQWDTGRRLRVGSGVEQIHYQNRALGCSVDVDVGADGTAIIPDELLQDCHTLTAYAYVTDDTGAYTMVQQDFAVHKRAKPAGYVYTPTDQMTLQTIQRQIGDLADLTTEAKDTLVEAINEVALMGGRMSLRVADGYIQYSTDGGSTWTNLIAVSDLKGAGMDITGATVGQIAKITAVDDSGKPTAWEPVDMPSGDGGGGSVQPDWNLNDETAADYVKNRPFYTGEPVETVLVEESTVSFAADGGVYMGQLESTFSATVGETYKVSWDGTTYECACVEVSGNTSIGNLSIVGAGSDTGEPFLIGVNNGQSIAIIAADTAPSHTFSISGMAAQVLKIDEKYLPGNLATKSEVEEVRSIAEAGKIDPNSADTFATLFSKSNEFIGWYEAMPMLKYDQTAGKFFNNPITRDPIKINEIPSGNFMCIAFLDFNLSGFYGEWYIMYLEIKSTSVGDKRFVTGPMISPKGNVFYVKSNEVDENTAEGIFFELLMPEYMMINSSTTDSTKKFRITVDDSGTISATEVT